MSEPHLPFIVEPDHLERMLGAEDLLVVDVGEHTVHAQHHIPGAVHLAYQAIIAVKPPAMGLLPDDRQLSEVLSAQGIPAPDTTSDVFPIKILVGVSSLFVRDLECRGCRGRMPKFKYGGAWCDLALGLWMVRQNLLGRCVIPV